MWIFCFNDMGVSFGFFYVDDVLAPWLKLILGSFYVLAVWSERF
jgi:hypothetical protein